MRTRVVAVVAAIAAAAMGVGLAPGGAGAAPEAGGDSNGWPVPTLEEGVHVDLDSMEVPGDIDLARPSGGLRPAAASITSVFLNGDALTVQAGSTGNALELGGTGFTNETEYRLTVPFNSTPDPIITNVIRTSSVQHTVVFDVLSSSRGWILLATKEPAEAGWTPVVLFQIYYGVGAFFPLSSPARILDSRNGTGGHHAPLPAGETWRIPVAGSNNIPAHATAVSLNLTAIGGVSSGFLSLYPAGGTRPDVSSVNFGADHRVVPNHVIVPLGLDGSLDLYNGGGDGVHPLIDIDGYYSGQHVSGGLLYWDEPPDRVLDMRVTGTVIQPGATATLTIEEPQLAVLRPGDVLDANVTITNQTGVGFVTVYPSNAALPNVSTHNWVAPFQDTANRVAVRVSAGNTISVHNGSTGTIQVIVDYFGSWNDLVGYRFSPVTPRRVFDTRSTGKLAIGESRSIDATPWVSLSPKPDLLVGNLTGDQPTSATFFQLWTGSPAEPPAPSNLNLQEGETRANSFIVANNFGSNSVNLRNAFGNAHAIIDVFGYFDD